MPAPTLRLSTIAALICLSASVHAAPLPTPRSGEQVYTQTCATCHESGVAGAPKRGDPAAWAPLISEGQTMLTSHAWVGVRGMPAKGGNPELTLVEFARAVSYIVNHSGGHWPEPEPSMLRQIRKEAVKRLDASIQAAKAMKAELQPQRLAY